jgi:anti-anti-sigma factor
MVTMGAEFQIEPRGDHIRRIIMPGVLDNSNADELASLLLDLHARDMQFVILDMSGLEFLSSAGVGSILSTVEMFRERGGDIILARVSEKIRHVLTVLDLHEYLEIHGTLEEADARCAAR